MLGGLARDPNSAALFAVWSDARTTKVAIAFMGKQLPTHVSAWRVFHTRTRGAGDGSAVIHSRFHTSLLELSTG